MATDEEYLDSLLKSMTDNESNRSMEEVMREVSKTPKEDDISFGVEDFFESSPELSEDILENISLLDDSAITADSDSADGVGELLEQDEWKLSLDDILAQAETQSGEAEADVFFDAPDWGDGEPSIDIPDIPEIPDVSETAQEADPVNAENMDVTDLIDGMDNTDVDLAEINGLLKSADSKESANDDMLALLEGVDVDQMDAFSDPDADSEFSIFSESDLEKSASYGSGSLDQTDKKKEKKAALYGKNNVFFHKLKILHI